MCVCWVDRFVSAERCVALKIWCEIVVSRHCGRAKNTGYPLRNFPDQDSGPLCVNRDQIAWLGLACSLVAYKADRRIYMVSRRSRGGYVICFDEIQKRREDSLGRGGIPKLIEAGKLNISGGAEQFP